MAAKIPEFGQKYQQDLLAFAQKLVQCPSYSDQEGPLAQAVLQEMQKLAYDECFIDGVGNVVGRIGQGGAVVLFDSHMDTVEVHDAEEWFSPPFSGEIVEGRLYGRGSVDMKSALAASVYGAALARELGFSQGKTVYVTATVCEEYCDGESLRLLLAAQKLRPDYAVICEPSNNVITLGHKGKAQLVVKTQGLSAHGSAPEKGLNAVYEMADIIKRVEQLNQRLSEGDAEHGTVVLSDISCVSASLNAVPSECSIYLDRRLALGETFDGVREELAELVRDKKAGWEVGELRRTTWTGAELCYQPVHDPWRIDEQHALTKACNAAYEQVFARLPQEYDFWDFSTNGVTTVSMGIPSIGFGPGEYKLAHMRDENCQIAQIAQACRFYAALIGQLS